MFKFSYFCSLLERTQNICCHDPPFPPSERQRRVAAETLLWFKSYRNLVDSLGSSETSALLSSLLPHFRKDRIYGLQSTSLVKLLGRCLALSATKRHDLVRYKSSGNGDLADCLERVLQGGGPPALPSVSLLEIDIFLHRLAGRSRFSAPQVRTSPESSFEGAYEEELKQILFRMSPVESKWLVRLILKDLTPAVLDDASILRQLHFLLPDLLKIHNDIVAVCDILKTSFLAFPSQPDLQSRAILRQTAAASVRPVPGLMIARSDFCKARSIKHCLRMTAGQKWLVERKYDGEYCQIHVDLDKGSEWLKIYSKSARDSTQDREGLHDTLRRCLRIGSDRCRIKRQCILVGEMVPYSEKDNCIVSFHNIRRHVSRAGTLLGAQQDSPVHDEHLMIVFFDLLLLDDEDVMNQSIERRKAMLGRIFKRIEGRAMSAESTVIDFGESGAERKLMHQFAASNALRHEGLVLKPCDMPYLSFHPASAGQAVPKSIKLKKDYITGLGDEADFAVVGASYDALEAGKRPELNLAWTHFHLGCLMNETDVERCQAIPVFKIVATMTMDHCIPLSVLQQINAEGKFLVENPPSAFTIHRDRNFRADVFFRTPFVFEVLGSSYSKPSNAGFFMLRHPRVKKLHGDRSWRDCITFDKLQDAAQEALAVVTDSDAQQNVEFLDKLEVSCKRKFSQMSCTTTPESAASILTPRSKTKKRMISRAEVPLIFVDNEGMSPSVHSSHLLPRRTTTCSVLATPPPSSPGMPFNRDNTIKVNIVTSIAAQTLAKQRSDNTDIENIPVASQETSEAVELSATSSHGHGKGTTHRPHPLADVTPCVRRSGRFKVITKHEALSERLDRKKSGAEGGNDCTEKSKPDTVRNGPDWQCRSLDMERRFLEYAAVYVDKNAVVNAVRVIEMLRKQGATIVEDIEHWERDTCRYAPLSETVSESQSFPGLQKMALVDSEKPMSVCAALAKILGLDQGRFREEVWLYDLKLVDVWSQAKGGKEESERIQWRRHGIGAVTYDALAGRSVFVPYDVESSAETT